MDKDKYNNFAELMEHEVGNYRIICEERDSNILVLVPHGGKIELGTTEIGRAIVNNQFSLYCFEGIKDNHNYKDLHITSTHFDECVALEMVGKSIITLVIHGCCKKHTHT